MAETTFVEIEQLIGASTNSALIETEEKKKSVSFHPIRKVPADIRKWKEEAYRPRMVAIGPYHCNMRRRGHSFEPYLDKLRSEYAGRKRDVMDEFDIRHYYGETMDDPNYVTDKLFDRDAYLVIGIFLQKEYHGFTDLITDLLLLENQLPFFLIEEVFRREYANTSSSLIELTFDHFRVFNDLNIKPSDLKIEIEHFTDLLRTFYLPPFRELPKRGRKGIKLLYTATQLQEAGVKIEVSSSKCILDFKFDFQTRLLQIPRLKLGDDTEILVRNVLALEQTRYVGNGYVTDYFRIMSSLVQSKEDLDLLRQLKIVITDEETLALSFFQDICKGMKLEDMSRDYILICKKLKKFHDSRVNLIRMWRKPLMRSAVIILVLTFIQTVCSVIQVLPK